MGRIICASEVNPARRCRHRPAGRSHPVECRPPIRLAQADYHRDGGRGCRLGRCGDRDDTAGFRPEIAWSPGRRGRGDNPCLPAARRIGERQMLGFLDLRRRSRPWSRNSEGGVRQHPRQQATGIRRQSNSAAARARCRCMVCLWNRERAGTPRRQRGLRWLDEGVRRSRRTWSIADAVRIAARKTREPITIFLPLLWLAIADETPTIDNGAVPESTYVNDVPLYSLDGHCRAGRQAIATFRRDNAEVAGFLSNYVPNFRAARALELAVFFTTMFNGSP